MNHNAKTVLTGVELTEEFANNAECGQRKKMYEFTMAGMTNYYTRGV